MELKLVGYNDVSTCIEFVEIVKDDFAGYEKEGFKKALEKCIKHGEAVSAINEAGNIIGLLLYSKADCELEFLAVHPEAVIISAVSKMMNCSPYLIIRARK